MNTENTIAEQAAEIANLNKVVSHLKAEITKLMGEAARADIARAPASVAQLAVPQDGPVAYAYECRQPLTDPVIWSEFFGRDKPSGSDWVRNVRPLYAAPDVAPLPAQPEQKQPFPDSNSAEAANDITCDQCIELEGELHREYARQAIAGTRAAASLLNEGAFRAGMETACDELETRLKLEPDLKSEVPTTRDDMWCALLAATDAYLNSDPDPAIMILRGDKQTWLALGTKAQIAMMCDGRSGAQMERDAAAAPAPAAPLPEQTGPSDGQQGMLSIERIVKNAILGNSHPRDDGYLMFLNEDEVTTVAWQVGQAVAAAPSSPAPAQQQESSASLTNEQIRTIMHKHSRYMGQPDYYSDTEFACLQDVIGFAREVLKTVNGPECTICNDHGLIGAMTAEGGEGWPCPDCSVEPAAPGASIGDAEPASTDCQYCHGLGEVQGQGSYVDFEPPINKCSQCDGTGKA